ncbi:hypothetical protein [Erwinia amylovora]|uniref:hypothetical protein n=1 Tax=Erwinia amylovora TaxID=552 RepID=UPI0014446C25|nr:hypothetical protein [Erwinia amylovora]
MLFFISSPVDFVKAHLFRSTDSACMRANIDNRNVQFARKLLSVKNAEAQSSLEKVQIKLKNSGGDCNKTVKYMEIKTRLMMKLKKYEAHKAKLAINQACIETEVKYSRMDESDSLPRPYVSPVNPNADYPPQFYRDPFRKGIIHLYGKENLV